MVMVERNGKTAHTMKVILRGEPSMVKEGINGQTEVYTMEFGSIII